MIRRFPLRVRDVEILALTCRSDEEAMRALLPEPLEPTGP
jgi:acetoacetate decarboxylase